LDIETGLFYYGYRYYSPELGRWTRWDPIGEEVSLNLYSFVNNAPAEYIDIIGLTKVGIAIPNGDASANNLFKKIAKQNSDVSRWKALETGQEILQFLAEQSILKNSPCGIKKLTIAGHGWNYRKGSNGGDGIPGVGSWVGLYLDSVRGLNTGSAKVRDLKAKVRSKTIRFADGCLIQIHSCRISLRFSKALANATKCRVVADTASAFPNRDDSSDPKWYSGPKNDLEKNNSPYIGWYEITPSTSLKDKILEFFGVDTTSTKNLGKVYDPQ
jgi:hypothetical protein